MRDILIIGNDLMDNRITIHKGQQITINDKDTEETLQLCREFPKYGLRLKEQEELAPRTAKLVICKCGLVDKEGNIPTKLLLTGENAAGLYIPRLVMQVEDDTVYAIIENHSDEFLELNSNQEVGYALPLQTTKIGKQIIYETPESDEGMYFLHNDALKEHILLGNVDSVLPTPHGYEEPEQSKTIDIEAIKADGLTEEQVRKLKQILKRFEGVFSTGPGDFGKTPLMSFRIETGDAKPYAARYYPIPLGYRNCHWPIDEPEHRDKTAFYTFGSQMRFKVSPFGAKYLPSQFNHLMATVLGDIDDNLFFYFDDIGSYQTADAMLRGLADVLQ